MGTSDVLKVFKIERDIVSDHKYEMHKPFIRFFFIISPTKKSLRNATFHALGAHLLETLFNGFQNARIFSLNRKYNNCDRQTKPKIIKK